jgi:hypothetical protein
MVGWLQATMSPPGSSLRASRALASMRIMPSASAVDQQER